MYKAFCDACGKEMPDAERLVRCVRWISDPRPHRGEIKAEISFNDGLLEYCNDCVKPLLEQIASA